MSEIDNSGLIKIWDERNRERKAQGGLAAMPGSVAHPGVWCCERRGQCKWKCYALEAAGLQWGTPDQVTPEWLKWHKRECGGRLVQLVPPNDGTHAPATKKL